MGKLWETKMHCGSHWKPPHQTSNVSNDQVLSPAVSSSLGSVEGLVTQTLKTFLSPFIPTSATLLIKQGRIVSHGVSITTGLYAEVTLVCPVFYILMQDFLAYCTQILKCCFEMC
mmetsp:Transcript_23296/g.41079  ORF Transcript_23296/g.41079 Transcript_23296/m.41079 type:complete len:115 (+) Transcript_23296:822-1166(+)